ncbi:CPCC family cysteine-rich protein [Streptomyces sp. NPDC058746]|uniref:CPCC family cysteine-rich protein n=1 Tax=Streptomyces sp. NPDC058746 TaxID=3346622 RepID=UPI00369DC92F
MPPSTPAEGVVPEGAHNVHSSPESPPLTRLRRGDLPVGPLAVQAGAQAPLPLQSCLDQGDSVSSPSRSARCFWEDDALQLRWPDWAVGANRTSLVQAQQNYQAFGACDERSVEHVRLPRDDEPQDRSWRPVDPEHDHFEPQGVQQAVWPVDRTVLYWWRYRNTGFWRPTVG